MNGSVLKVKRHRFYKNVLCLSIILVASLIMALVIMDMNGINIFGSNVEDLIFELSNRVANGTDLGDLDPSELEKNNIEIFKFNTSYAGPIYFRSSSTGDWDSKTDSFSNSPKKVSGSNGYSPLVYYPNKALNSGSDVYDVSVNILRSGQKEFIPDYSEYGKNSNNDCYLARTIKGESSYTTQFVPSFEYEDALNVSYSRNFLTSDELKYYEHVKSYYLTITDELKQELQTFCNQNNLSANSPTIINDVKLFLKNNYSYDLDVPSSEGKDVILFFLQDSKRGICNNFAASATMIYRTLGIPARFVNGFLSRGSSGGERVVQLRHAHAWTEVYIPTCGWCRIDATGDMDGLDSSRWNEDFNFQELLEEEIEKSPQYSFIVNDDHEIYYDGKNHSLDELQIFEVSIEGKNYPLDETTTNSFLPEGVEVVKYYSNNVNNLKNVGSYYFLAYAKLYLNGEDITAQYNGGVDKIGINKPLRLIIKPRPIIVTTTSADYSLNNTNYVVNQTEVSVSEVMIKGENVGGIAEGHHYEYEFTYPYFTTSGTYVNKLTIFTIFDENNQDVTVNYSIYNTNGTIKVE